MLSKVAVDYNIPYDTLKYHVNKHKNTDLKDVEVVEKILEDRNRVLSFEIENESVSYIQYSTGIFLGLTPTEIHKLAYELAAADVENEIKIPQSWIDKEMAGKDWFILSSDEALNCLSGNPKPHHVLEYLVSTRTMLKNFSTI